MALERSGTNPCLDVPYLLTKNDAFLNRRILDIFTAPIGPGSEQQVEVVGHEGPGVTGGPRLDENLAEAAEKILPIRWNLRFYAMYFEIAGSVRLEVDSRIVRRHLDTGDPSAVFPQRNRVQD